MERRIKLEDIAEMLQALDVFRSLDEDKKHEFLIFSDGVRYAESRRARKANKEEKIEV